MASNGFHQRSLGGDADAGPRLRHDGDVLGQTDPITIRSADELAGRVSAAYVAAAIIGDELHACTAELAYVLRSIRL